MNVAELLAQGWNAHQADDLVGAERIYRQGVAREPTNFAAWCFLGMACHDQQRYDEAEAAYRRSLHLNKAAPETHNNLGNTLRLLNRLPESLACFDEALRLRPEYANAYRNKASAIYWSGELESAVKFFEKSIELKPEDPEAHLNLGIALLLKGDFDRGWREYNWRLRTKGYTPPRFPQPMWNGESLDGKTILLTTEQGLGDTIQFIRYGSRLKERYRCRVLAYVTNKLLPFLQDCPGIDGFYPSEQPVPSGFDVFSPLLELPRLLNDDIRQEVWPESYLHTTDGLIARWREELAPYTGLRVGIVWQGNPKHAADAVRSIPLKAMTSLSRLAGVHFFSLQKGHGVEQLEDFGGRFPIIQLGDRLDENTGAFMETAAVMKNLDLVIAIDSAVAHVAGAIGVPVWIALSHVPDWRWQLGSERTPWYPSARLFRKPADGEWSGVFERMTTELIARGSPVRWKTPDEYRLAASGSTRLVAAKHGLMLYDRRDQHVGRSLEQYGEAAEGDIELIQQLVKPGAWAMEVDAGIGAHTLVLADLVGAKGSVLAYEANRSAFQILSANAAINSVTNIATHEEFLGATVGTIPSADVNSPPARQRTIDALRLTRLDFLKSNSTERVLDVLRGASETLRRCHPIVYVAVDKTPRLAELIALLESHDYELYWHEPRVYRADNYFHRPLDSSAANVQVARVLGVPKSLKASIRGLPRLTRESLV